jgi:hypothetical protein
MAGATSTGAQRGIQGLAQRANPAFAGAAVVIPLLALAGAIAADDIRALTYGLVLGPVVGSLDPEERGSFFAKFTPKMTFLMPVLAMVTITGGILLAQQLAIPHLMPWLAIMTAGTAIPVVALIGMQFDALTEPKTLAALAVAILGSGIFLATTLPDFAVASPWVVATIVIVTLLSVQGFGVILPGEVRIYRQLTSENPDFDVIGDIGMRNAKLGGIQGALQLALIFVMVGLRYGLYL